MLAFRSLSAANHAPNTAPGVSEARLSLGASEPVSARLGSIQEKANVAGHSGDSPNPGPPPAYGEESANNATEQVAPIDPQARTLTVSNSPGVRIRRVSMNQQTNAAVDSPSQSLLSGIALQQANTNAEVSQQAATTSSSVWPPPCRLIS